MGEPGLLNDQSVQVPLGSERKYTTISIPTQLYKNVEKVIENTGFRSVTEFIVFVTRETLAGNQGTVVDRLKALGYLE